MNNNSQIISSATNKGIKNLVHFTNACNLQSILLRGLCTRRYLDDQLIEYEYNDYLRLDEADNSISLSVTFPNYKMFYKLRQDNPSINWVVLTLNASLILNLDCAFCYTNAANNNVSSIPLESRKNVKSFNSMFNERGKYSRAEMKLSSYETTDPQAEILVFDNITSNAIKYVNFPTDETRKYYSNLPNPHGISFKCDPSYFNYRKDYNFW